jgi:membrane-associated phospholipid phosphatase
MANLVARNHLTTQTFLPSFTTSLVIWLVVFVVTSMVIPKGAAVVWINSHHTKTLDYFFAAITLLGDGLWVIPVLLYLLFVRFAYVLQFAFASILCGALVSLGKRILFTDAGRPITYLDNSLLHFVEGVKVHTHHSFPSGHTATAFTIAVALSLYLKNRNATVVLLVLATLVGYSRIYLLQHFLLDAAAGACIGSFSVLLMYYLNPFARKSWTQQNLQLKLSKQLEPSQN